MIIQAHEIQKGDTLQIQDPHRGAGEGRWARVTHVKHGKVLVLVTTDSGDTLQLARQHALRRKELR